MIRAFPEQSHMSVGAVVKNQAGAARTGLHPQEQLEQGVTKSLTM